MNIKRIMAAFGGTTLVALAMPLTASAATTNTVVVTSANTQGWSTADTRANGHVNFVATTGAPLGSGALQLKTDAATGSPLQDKAQYMKQTKTKLADVKNVSYSTKQNAASFVAGLPSFQLAVCLYGASATGCNPVPNTTQSSFTTLVYEPYVDQGNAAVQSGAWQQWNVATGKLWSSKTVANLVSTQGSTTYLLSDLKASYPDAVVTSFGVNVGSNNPNYDTLVDAVVFNDTTYNFEPTLTPSKKDDCKNNGWKTFNTPVFKNQGKCVDYVEHHNQKGKDDDRHHTQEHEHEGVAAWVTHLFHRS